MTEKTHSELFTEIYSGKAPWDIGRPQPAFVEVAEQVYGLVLDSGCGTGEHALYFSDRDCVVVGMDFLEHPVELARAKAKNRGTAVDFVVADALRLKDFEARFDNVLDSGLFHVFSDEERSIYVAGLAHVLRSGGRLFLLCFSDQEPGTDGPRRVTQQEIRDVFSTGFVVESINPARFEVIADLPPGRSFSPGGPLAWFAVIRRK